MTKDLKCLTKNVAEMKKKKKRRLRDSNPRTSFLISSFRGWRNRPLCQIFNTTAAGFEPAGRPRPTFRIPAGCTRPLCDAAKVPLVGLEPTHTLRYPDP